MKQTNRYSRKEDLLIIDLLPYIFTSQHGGVDVQFTHYSTGHQLHHLCDTRHLSSGIVYWVSGHKAALHKSQKKISTDVLHKLCSSY